MEAGVVVKGIDYEVTERLAADAEWNYDGGSCTIGTTTSTYGDDTLPAVYDCGDWSADGAWDDAATLESKYIRHLAARTLYPIPSVLGCSG